MATVFFRDFEWDDAKATRNARKHGITFEEATTVFDAPRIAVKDDPTDPENCLTIGYSAAARMLLVVTTERGDRTRIISARKADKDEAREYERDA